MKRIILAICVLLSVLFAKAQSVGIGTNTPNNSSLLEISSSTKGLLIPRMTTAQRLAIALPAIGLMCYDTDLSSFYFYNGTAWTALNGGSGGSNGWAFNGVSQYNTNTGNTGIGITTPGSKLHLVGDFLQQQGSFVLDNTSANIFFKSSNATQGFLNVIGSDHDMAIGTYAGNATGNFSIHMQSQPKLTMLPAGNIGIGTIFPSQKLDVAGNIRSRRNIYADSSIRSDGAIIAGTALSGNSLSVGNNMVIGGSGTVAGEITSFSSLTINNATGILNLKTGSTDKGFVQLSGDDLRVGTYSGNSTGRFLVRTGGANRLAVTSEGEMGIGTETPLAFMHVNSGAQNSTLRLQSDNFPSLLFYQGTTSIGSIVGGADFFNISAAGKLMRLNTTMVIDGSTLNVGIGTSTPEEKLHVAGSIRVSEVHRVETGSFNLVPVCYGRVSNLGSLLSGTPNITDVFHQPQTLGGYFQIACPQVTTSSVVQVTIVGGLGASAIPVVQVSNGFIQIKFFNDFGEFNFSDNDVIGAQVPFHFVVYNP